MGNMRNQAGACLDNALINTNAATDGHAVEWHAAVAACARK
jgi:hypothetical protein